MSTKINREKFLAVLQSVQAGLSPKEKIEQSTCFTFKGGIVSTFNEEIACQTESGLGDSIQGAVKAKQLLEILQKLPDDEITIKTLEGEIILKGHNRKAGMSMEKEVNLSADIVETPKEWKKLPDNFADAVEITAQCVGGTNAKFNLTCIHITPKYIEAGDRFQVCRYRTKIGIEKEALIKGDVVKNMTSLGMVEFSETPTWLHFRNTTGLIFSCRKYLDEYENLTPFLTFEGNPTTLPKGLMEAAQSADVFCRENVDVKGKRVLVELFPGKIRITGRGVYGWYKESKAIPSYKGKPLTFTVAPALLMEAVKKQSDCIITDNRLMVDGGRYKYCIWLGMPDKKNTSEEESTNGVEE